MVLLLAPLAWETLKERPLRRATPWRDVTSTGRSTPVSGIPVLSRSRARNAAGGAASGGIQPASRRAAEGGDKAGKAVARHRALGCHPENPETQADWVASDSVEGETVTVAEAPRRLQLNLVKRKILCLALPSPCRPPRRRPNPMDPDDSSRRPSRSRYRHPRFQPLQPVAERPRSVTSTRNRSGPCASQRVVGT
jgi:hypothetical protein